MGNRSYVAFPGSDAAVYLHWNGGLESVLAFLDFMNERGDRDGTYGAARFCQIVGNFFGGTLSVGVQGCIGEDGYRALSEEDNGCMVVGLNDDGKLTVVRWFINEQEASPELLAARMTTARAHKYHQPDADGDTLLDTIRKNNAIPADAPKAKP